MRNPRLKSLTTAAIKNAAKELSPASIRKWSVMVDGRELPAKQVVMEAANYLSGKFPRVTPADFTAHEAVRILKQLGFEVRYSE